jgi:ring-1,2-phenylacetyl-CoA epoxidase subunit PaaC
VNVGLRTSADAALVTVVTPLADDELILGHRNSEWTGYAPHIEEDVAFSSIAQDEIGHAAALYGLIGEITGDDPNRLALGRQQHEYLNALLCERPNKDWAFTLARHWLYDTADNIRLEALEHSAEPRLAAVVRKIRREERYHTLHATTWIKRVARGPVEARTKLVEAISDSFDDAVALFEPLEHEDEIVGTGILPVASDELRRTFLDRTATALDELGYPTHVHARADERADFVASSSGDLIADQEPAATEPPPPPRRAKRGQHSADFHTLWDVMTRTYRENPGATW